MFPGFLIPVLKRLFFPKPPTTFLTCFCRGEMVKYAGKKVRLNPKLNSHPPGHKSDTLTTEPTGQGEMIDYKEKLSTISLILLKKTSAVQPEKNSGVRAKFNCKMSLINVCEEDSQENCHNCEVFLRCFYHLFYPSVLDFHIYYFIAWLYLVVTGSCILVSGLAPMLNVSILHNMFVCLGQSITGQDLE